MPRSDARYDLILIRYRYPSRLMLAEALCRIPTDKEFTQLTYAEESGLARITLARPEVRNALSMQLSDELIAALELVRRSHSIKVLVIQGAGETFCAGDDITEMPAWGQCR